MVLIINKNKVIKTSLKSNYGIGSYQAFKICKLIGLNLRKNIKKLKKKTKLKLYKCYKPIKLNTELKQRLKQLSAETRTLKTYKSLRHRKGLPARGQRTHTNGKTKKKFRY